MNPICEQCGGELVPSATISNVAYCHACRLEYQEIKDAEGELYTVTHKISPYSSYRILNGGYGAPETAPCCYIRRYAKEKPAIVPDSSFLTWYRAFKSKT